MKRRDLILGYFKNKIGEPSGRRETVLERYVTIRDITFKITRVDSYVNGQSEYTIRYKQTEGQPGNDIYIKLTLLNYAFDLHAFYNLLGTPESRGLGLELLCFILKTVFEDEPWKVLGFARPDTIDLLAFGGGPQSNSKKPLDPESVQNLVSYYERLGFRRDKKSAASVEQKALDMKNGVFMEQSVDAFLQGACSKFATTLAKKAEIIGVGGSQTVYQEQVPVCVGPKCKPDAGGGGSGGGGGGGGVKEGVARALNLSSPNFTFVPGSTAAQKLAAAFVQKVDLDTTVGSLPL
jgi:hypothetical protein